MVGEIWRLSRRFCCGWYALGLCLLAACSSDMPALLHIERMVPSAVEENDALLFSGDGFVANATARVHFSGRLFRAGAVPEPLHAVTEGKGLANDRVEVAISPELGDQLLGTPKRHATFRGSIEIAFRAARAGAPPVAGRLENVVLDMYPGVESQTDLDATGLVEFLGLTVQRRGDVTGLTILDVHAGGRAQRAGLQVADRIVVYGGVNVHALSDLLPYPGQRVAAIGVRRAGTLDVTERAVDVAGFVPRNAENWLLGLALAGAAGILLLVLRGPLGALMAMLEVAGRTPFLDGSKARSKRRPLAPRGLPVFVAISIGFLLIGTRAHLPAAEIDLAWLSLCALVLLALAGLTEGGLRRDGKWSAASAFSSLLRQLPVQVAIAVVLFAVGLDRGSLSLAEISAQQGALPWGYFAFTSPVGFLTAACLFSALLLSRPALLPPKSQEPGSAGMRLLGHTLFECYWLLMLAIVVAVFFGGWQLLGSGPHLASNTAALLAFQVKYSLIYVLGVELRERMPLIPAWATQRLVWRWLVPAASCIPLLVPVWAAPVWPGWLRTSCGVLFLILTLLLSAALVARARWMRTQLPAHTSLNPWL